MLQVTLNFRQSAQAQNLEGADTTFGGFLSGILEFVMVIAALMVLLYLIWGAIEWITSAGDKGKTQKARDKMTNAVIGIIVLASVVAIFSMIQRFLGINVIDFN